MLFPDPIILIAKVRAPESRPKASTTDPPNAIPIPQACRLIIDIQTTGRVDVMAA